MRFLKILAVAVGVFTIYCIVEATPNFNINLPYVECSDGYRYVCGDGIQVNWSKQKCREEVERLFNNPMYMQIPTPFYRSFCSYSTRIIGMNYRLTGCNYIQELAHELVHLTEWSGNERYTEYRTFVRLWESEVPELHEAGRRLAKQKYLSNKKGNDYDCWYYIKEYLKGESYGANDFIESRISVV